MIDFYDLEGEVTDFSSYCARHSGDENINYITHGDEKVYMSYFFPPEYDRTKKYPTFILIHGGDWYAHHIFEDQTEWAGDYLGYLARYYADRGFLAISMDHGLEHEMQDGHTIMDCYDDCMFGVDYILDRADEYGIDLDRVYVSGESSGGHLAAMLATTYKREGFQFKMAFLGYPVTDFMSDKQAADDKIPPKSNSRAWAKADPSEYAAIASPVCYIDDTTCPCVIIHGEDDPCVFPQHSTLFHDLMLEHGRECTLHMIRGTSHAFWLAEFTDQYLANSISVRLIDEHLRALGENL